MSRILDCKSLTKAAPRKSNILKADARANPPEHVRFRVEVFVHEQRGYSSDTGYQELSHERASGVGARQFVSSEVVRLNPTLGVNHLSKAADPLMARREWGPLGNLSDEIDDAVDGEPLPIFLVSASYHHAASYR